MRVLTVKNPWAYLIIHYGKDIENRSRKTNYRGRILIHASKKSDECAYFLPWSNKEIQKIFDEVKEKRAEIEKLNGHIIGGVQLYNCTYPELTKVTNDSPWAEPLTPWHYWLRQAVPFAEPIPARGMLGLWEYDLSEAQNAVFGF
jgi:hypothetical protein